MSIAAEKSIFLSALELTTDEERAAYLDKECGDDQKLRQAVDALLAMHHRSENVLDKVAYPVEAFRDQLMAAGHDIREMTERSDGSSSSDDVGHAGQVIGNFHLLEKIGEGGFGEVYVAEQRQPVRRRVALKLLKPGMNSREVIARFEAERQALAMMDHPNIATVFDAGQTSDGQPYFVMELVRGVPITAFCDQRQLTTRERLGLFIDVCRAVQHAHQKGVIHRDLKPSNVLVTLHDGVPVVKVIDFGVAKAISEPLTTRTLYTRFAQMIGTPLYMSPEQAEMSGLDVDTRSDIYSLGVMLYELVTGTTPFDQRRIETATFDELRRIIREEDPPRPSVRLSTLGQAMTTAAANQRADVRTLASVLRGDVDWIAMKALEKDRRRRYETAGDLARDIQRHLEQQPVLARPPSKWYLFTKFAHRHKAVLTTAALVLAVLLIGTTVSTWQAIRATRAQTEADVLRMEAVEFADRLKEANVLLDSARANADEGRWGESLSQYTTAINLQPEHYLAWSGRGSLYTRLGLWDLAASDYVRAIDLGAPANNPGWWGVPQLCVYSHYNHAYQLACGTLEAQLEQSSDPTFVAMAIRSLTITDDMAVDYSALAERMQQLPADPSQSRMNLEGRNRFQRAPPSGYPPRGPRRGGSEFDGFGRGPRAGGGHRGPMELPPDMRDYVTGLAHLRAGSTELAIARLQNASELNSFSPISKVALPALAIAYQIDGQHDAAKQALSESEKTIDELLGQLSSGSLESLPMPWFDFLECLILHREAYREIRGTAYPQDPRLAAFRAAALALLNAE